MHNEITKAIASHVMWKASLITAIHAGENTCSLAVIQVEDQCTLGKWLEGPLPPGLKDSPHYKKSVELNREFHEVASRVLSLALDGRRTEALRALDVDGDLTKASALLVNELKAWNNAQCTERV
jgi:chemoreceptor zinc-binding protein